LELALIGSSPENRSGNMRALVLVALGPLGDAVMPSGCLTDEVLVNLIERRLPLDVCLASIAIWTGAYRAANSRSSLCEEGLPLGRPTRCFARKQHLSRAWVLLLGLPGPRHMPSAPGCRPWRSMNSASCVCWGVAVWGSSIWRTTSLWIGWWRSSSLRRSALGSSAHTCHREHAALHGARGR
jgi:hypothetical protein